MLILQNLKDFIENPMGRGSTAIQSRQLIRDDLNRRFNRIFTEKKEMQPTIYKDGEEYYFHLKVPSEDLRRHNTYDVVLQFTLGEDGEDFVNDKNLKRYYVKFFSNSPSFTYTFAHAFHFYGALVENLVNKYHKKVFDQLPLTRNPGQIINYEKTIYFASHYILSSDKYLNKMIIDPIAKPFKQSDFNKLIRNTDQIELEIKKEKRRVSAEEEKREKELNREIRSTLRKGTVTKAQNKPTTVKAERPNVRTVKPTGKTQPKRASKGKIRPR